MPIRDKRSASSRVSRSHHRVAKNRSKTVNLLFLFFAFCLLFSIFFGRKLYLAWKNSIWTGISRLTIVVATADPKIYSFDPSSGRSTMMTIPRNTQVEAAWSYGNWPAGSLWELGMHEGKGGDLLRQSLQKNLGIPVDAWIGEAGEKLFASQPLGFLSSLAQAVSSGRAKTNLTFFDRLRLVSSGLSGAKQKEIDLPSAGVLKKVSLSDGTEGFVVVREKAKVVLDLSDAEIFKEGRKVVIVNSSDKSGLALQVAQIVGGLGLRVIGTQTGEGSVDCEVKGEHEQLKSLSARRLVQVFSCNLQEEKLDGPEDLRLMLGEDFARRF